MGQGKYYPFNIDILHTKTVSISRGTMKESKRHKAASSVLCTGSDGISFFQESVVVVCLLLSIINVHGLVKVLELQILSITILKRITDFVH